MQSSQAGGAPKETHLPLRSATPDSHLRYSKSKARWEHLRQHVLPSSEHPSETPPTLSQPPSASSRDISFSRPSTPKISRFPRLGFRHIVEHAREVGDSRKFGEEVLKACWAARYPDVLKGKVDKDQATIGSALYLPFMSTTSITTTSVSSTHGVPSTKKNDFRAVQASQPSLAAGLRSTPSLRYLHQIIDHHANIIGDAGTFTVFPYENQVLSTLLFPFLSPQMVLQLEEEQILAVQLFDLISRTWPPDSEAASVERCLWCCKAALAPSTIRAQIIGILWRILAPGDGLPIVSVQAVQSIAYGLFTLLASFYSPSISVDIHLVKELIIKFMSTSYGEVDSISIEEWYNVGAETEDQGTIRKVIILDAFTICLENSSVKTCIWLLQHAIEDYWPSSSGGSILSPFLSTILSRRLVTFGRLSLNLLSKEELVGTTKITMIKQIYHITNSRVIPDANRLQGKYALDAQNMVIRVLYEMLCLDDMMDIVEWSSSILCRWYSEDASWKTSMEKSLHRVITGGNWAVTLRLLLAFSAAVTPQICKSMFTFALPLINDQLVETPPSHPCSQLTNLLQTLSHIYPQLFYKPLFSCAASSKEFTVVNHLCVLKVHSKFLPDYWTRDAEMLSVALMSDAGAKKETLKGERTGAPWAKARLGQSVIMLEIIAQMQAIRHQRELSNSEHSFSDIIKFVTTFEARVSILLEARERTVLISPSQRMLFFMLFREFRLLTRSLRRSTWIEKTISWFIEFFADDRLENMIVHEPKEAVTQIQGLYEAAQSGVSQTHKRHTTMLFASTTSTHSTPNSLNQSKEWDLVISFAEQSKLIESLSDGYTAKAMKLLTSISQMISEEEYRRLGPVVWQHGLLLEEMHVTPGAKFTPSHRKHSSTAMACFLVMQCAEKSPLDLLAIIEVDMQTSDDTTRLEAVRKISILINWRFQILTQNIIMDKSHRPFKLARPPLPFVPTDMGSTLYIPEENYTENDDNVPSEIRKRLAEIGWSEVNAPTDERVEWMRTPMSLLPANQLDRLVPASVEHGLMSPGPLNTFPISPRRSASPSEDYAERTLLRRTSSSGGPIYTSKRRAIFVPALSSIFTRLAALIYDLNFAVASTARNTILDLMRSDPGLLTRPVLDLLSGDHKDVSHASYILTAFLHVKRSLPPPMSHHVFNNIAGFMKMSSRQSDIPDTLQDFAFLVPVLSQLILQVSGMSIREIRRAKVDSLLIPSGSLWFSSSSPPGPMFPRFHSGRQDPFQDPMTQIAAITMIRTSQNLLFLSMLKRNSQEVHLIRKNMTRLVLPSLDSPASAKSLELKDFVPRKLRHEPSSVPDNITALSLMLSRSYLLLVSEVFRSMSRHLNDRNELAVLIDGLNRILLAHGDDIGIISQAMIALMIASTRFRRLFTSGGAYGLFMPAVVKVYTEYSTHPGITLAIEYAINRFYALHQEAFLFQSLDAIARVLMLQEVDVEWTGKGIYTLFFSLTKGITHGTPDAAGIHNINRRQEREALLVDTAETRPQAFLSSMRKPEAGGPISIDLPQEYESRRLAMDNFVRLFLTVIAHDPNIIQAEHFLRLLRVLTPSLYNASSTARSILQEGIGALCNVLSKNSLKSKASDIQALSGEEKAAFLLANPTLESQLAADTKLISDLASMRLDFLHLVLAFGRAGGLVSLSIARQILDLVRIVLKDATGSSKDTVASFFSEFLKSLLLRNERPSVKAVVTFLREVAPIIHTFSSSIDFSGVFETICEISAVPMYAKELTFSQVVVTEICTAGLAVCELAASENYLSTLPCRQTVIALLGQAVLLQGADIVAEIEKRAPTHIFLLLVVLPMTISIKNEAQLAVNNLKPEPWFRDSLTRAWVRLISYVMSACQKSLRAASDVSSKEKRYSTASETRIQLQLFVAALQIMKVIIVQADAPLSANLPGFWERLASFLKTVLSEGNAEFLLLDHSMPPSPIASPRTSSQFDLSTGNAMMSSHEQAHSSPRIIDYALWSFFEFLCAYRSPLKLQLRLFLAEKVVGLNDEIRRHHGSLTTPFPSPLSGRRVSTSIFVKPRGRTSTHATPDSSPRASALQLSSLDISLSSLNTRKPGYQISPITPSSPTGANFARPKIIHLGPTTPSALRNPPPSPGGTGGGNFHIPSKSPKIRSLSLMNTTYQRIRCIQTFMGYEPFSLGSMGSEPGVMPMWTKRQALNAIEEETKQLVEEFEEIFNEDSVLVELDSTISFSSS
ncbi:hypothetical protein BDQ17DRAFT_1235125 [Cyathus striatus]|nr:hypothetical protein BDQ17DRAFT_1235125 [Cyathus striatus]